MSDTDEPQPEIDPYTPERRRRSGRKVAMAAIAVVALLATGAAVLQLTADDGADSPEAAVEAFFDAIEKEDALGVLESLTPSERDVLVPSVQQLAEQLADKEVADGLDLDKVGGLDLRIDELTLRTTGLHPDVATVETTGGTITTSADFRALPLGKALTATLEETGGRDLDEPVEGSEKLGLTLVTRKSAEGWHVSLLYSIAEADRRNDGTPVPDFGNGVPAEGAASPTEAVEAMVAAFNEGDIERLIELTPLDTMAVLHDYGPRLLVGEDHEPTARLDGLKLGEPTGSGGTRRVPVEGYTFHQSDGDYELSITYDGSCVTTEWTGDSSAAEGDTHGGMIIPDAGRICAEDRDRGSSFLGALPVGPLLGGAGDADVVVVERDGAWFVDPSRSIVDGVLRTVGDAMPEQIDALLEYWSVFFSDDEDAFYALYDTFESCPGVEPPADDASFEERKEAGRRCSEAMFSEDGEWTNVGPDEGAAIDPVEPEVGEGEALPEDVCYEQDDPAAVEACIEDLGDPEALREFHEIECYDAADDAAIEACLRTLGDPEAVGEFHADLCYDSDDDGAIESCLQDLVDKGELDPAVVAEFRCGRVYDEMEDLVAADAAFDHCLADAGVPGGG